MDVDDIRRLTPRQREILALYAQGLTRSSIARKLHISVHTVRVHRADIVTNLGASSIVQAAIIGLARGEIVLTGEDVTFDVDPPVALQVA